MREQDEKVRGVMEEHRPEEERREDQAVGESHDEEQDHEEVTEGDLETFGGGGGAVSYTHLTLPTKRIV